MKEIISYVINHKILQKLTLSKSSDNTILRTTGRLTEMKGNVFLSLETFYTGGKTSQVNIAAYEATEYLINLIPDSYKQLNITTASGNCEIKVSKKGKITVLDHIKKNQCQQIDLSHNRKKQYIIPDNEPVDFLIALGVQYPKGFVYDKKRSKFRQINRFLEIVSDVENSLVNDGELYILDLCCGKSYLSFAVYYYFSKLRGYKVTMDCVDLKADVIEYCCQVADKLNYKGLHFVSGDIRDFPIRRTPDLTVSLHACDIATDTVLAKGIDSGSKVILSTPCCHHEMMHQLKPTGNYTDFLLEHSILKQKLADAATDALRCKVLEINGYDVIALELIDPEETPKNVLIRAIKRSKTNDMQISRLKEEYNHICNTLGIKPYLQDKYVN